MQHLTGKSPSCPNSHTWWVEAACPVPRRQHHMHWQYSRKACCTLLQLSNSCADVTSVLACLADMPCMFLQPRYELLLISHSGQHEQQLAYMPDSSTKLSQQCRWKHCMHVTNAFAVAVTAPTVACRVQQPSGAAVHSAARCRQGALLSLTGTSRCTTSMSSAHCPSSRQPFGAMQPACCLGPSR